MSRWIVHFFATAATLLVLAHVLPGVHVSGWPAALIAAVVLGLVNAIVRPVMFVLTLPITILTLGLFLFVLNALMLWLTQWLVPGFRVRGAATLLLASVLLSLVGMTVKAAFADSGRER